MNEMTTLTIRLTRQELDYLRDLASRMGYKIGRGNHANEGSVRQMLRALARADLGITAADMQNFATRRIDP